MLFRHGRVSEQTKNSTYSKVLFDVSAYTYESIVGTLVYLKAPFDEATMLPHEGQIPYPEKVRILAKWLKENWPGCENLEIPGEAGPASGATMAEKPGVAQPPPAAAPHPTAAKPASASAHWIWIASILAGVALLVVIGRSRLSR